MYIEKKIEKFIIEQTEYLTELWLEILENGEKGSKKFEQDIFNELMLTSEEVFGDDLSYTIQEELVKRIIKNGKKIARENLDLN